MFCLAEGLVHGTAILGSGTMVMTSMTGASEIYLVSDVKW